MRKLLALIDMDDTLCDTRGQRIRDLRKISKDESEVNPDYLSPNCPPYVQERLRLIMSQPGWWENLQKLEDGFQLYELVKSEGFETQILSKAPETYDLALTEKKKWCNKNVPGSKVALVPEKFRYAGDILIDDWPDYVIPWLNAYPKSRAILPLREWNKNCKDSRVIHYTGKNLKEIKIFLDQAKYRANRI